MRRAAAALAAWLILATSFAACGGGDGGEPNPSDGADTAAAASRPSEVRLTSTFASPRYGYALRYPAGWSALQAERPLASDQMAWTVPAHDAVDRFGEDPHGAGLPRLVVGAQDLAEGTTLDDLQAATLRKIDDRVGCGEPQAERDATVAGEPARVLTFAPCASNDLFVALLLHEGSGYHVVWGAGHGRAAEDRPVYEAILDSMTFTDERR